jgi:hypothetical protein
MVNKQPLTRLNFYFVKLKIKTTTTTTTTTNTHPDTQKKGKTKTKQQPSKIVRQKSFVPSKLQSGAQDCRALFNNIIHILL